MICAVFVSLIIRTALSYWTSRYNLAICYSNLLLQQIAELYLLAR